MQTVPTYIQAKSWVRGKFNIVLCQSFFPLYFFLNHLGKKERVVLQKKCASIFQISAA